MTSQPPRAPRAPWRPWRPWEGAAQRADRVLLAGIVLRGLYRLAVLPLVPLLLASQPLLLALLSGSSVAQVVVGANVRLGEVPWAVAVLAGLPAWVLFDWLYWWAGRRWGERALVLVLGRGGRPGAVRRARRAEAVVSRFGPVAVLLAWFLPVPRVVVLAAAGLAGMRLRVFLVLDLLGTVLAMSALVALGWFLGRGAVDLVERLDRAALLLALGTVAVLLLAGALGRGRRRRAGTTRS